MLTKTKCLNLPEDLREARAALVVAHPGHELRLHGWMELARPCVFVLTDGSGREQSTRLSSSERILAAVGASSGNIFGRFPDREVYQLLLQHRHEVFVNIAKELAIAFEKENIDYVVGDAAEDQILTHDICRFVINTAMELLNLQTGKRLSNYEFSPNHPHPDEPPPGTITLELSEAMLNRKLQAAISYHQIQHEVESALQQLGMTGLQIELLQPVLNWSEESRQLAQSSKIPNYETHGQQLVISGIYPEAIRYRDHVLPLIKALNSLWS